MGVKGRNGDAKRRYTTTTMSAWWLTVAGRDMDAFVRQAQYDCTLHDHMAAVSRRYSVVLAEARESAHRPRWRAQLKHAVQSWL